jgi:hypothetical protein
MALAQLVVTAPESVATSASQSIMSLKPDDLWDFHSLVASYVLPTKKLCEALLQVPVDKAAILKSITKIQPNPKIHKPKKYYAFGAAYVAANQKADFQLNPLYANWHHRFVRDADKFHARLGELGPGSASFDFEKAAAIAVESKPDFENCTLQFLKKELNAAIALLKGEVAGAGADYGRSKNVKSQTAKGASTHEDRPSRYVTLVELVGHSGTNLRSLRKLVADGVLPPPSIQQSGSDPEQWDWEVVKPILERIREESQSLSVSGLAKRWGVSTKKIYALIDSGELKAINTSVGPGKRPRYSIPRREVERLEQSRAVVSEAAAPVRRNRATKSQGIKDYF